MLSIDQQMACRILKAYNFSRICIERKRKELNMRSLEYVLTPQSTCVITHTSGGALKSALFSKPSVAILVLRTSKCNTEHKILTLTINSDHGHHRRSSTQWKPLLLPRAIPGKQIHPMIDQVASVLVNSTAIYIIVFPWLIPSRRSPLRCKHCHRP